MQTTLQSSGPSAPQAERASRAEPQRASPERSAEETSTEPLDWKERLIDWLDEHQTTIIVYGISTVFHTVLLIVLALTVIQAQRASEVIDTTILTEASDRDAELEEIEIISEEPVAVESQEMPEAIVAEEFVDESDPLDININESVPSVNTQLPQELTGPDVPLTSNLAGRSQAARAALVAAHGGTEASEQAVALGLKWLARHQNRDGSWSFDHTRAACRNSCTRPGSLNNCPMGATAMSLLSFLGAGHTHKQGSYRKQVERGLKYVLEHMERVPAGGDLRHNSPGNTGMYVQGLATIALCEAYVLTEDPDLRRVAQFAINFIVQAQHPTGGGWRYQPRQSGDTSVVGWQLMALTSARVGKLDVPRKTLSLSTRFLNRVQSHGGARYGYTNPGSKPSTTAVGLLCRMYLGWKPDNPILRQGIEFLDQHGPAKDNMYYNYYATQVMHHWGGKPWERWNEVMREQLVKSQAKNGHAEGSWLPRDPHGNRGGRHYMTCLCIMTLEVYYRHLPLYQRESISKEV